MQNLLGKLFDFTRKQLYSCLFPGAIFITLCLSKHLPLGALPRYDFILIMCLLMQVFMVLSKLETLDELKVICCFHLLGLALEIYKVQMGSWAYPEASYCKVFNVPIYSGFMYASVASYICQAWRHFELQFTGWPSRKATALIATAIYLNFFTHHFTMDFRWWLMLALLPIFWRSWVHFKVQQSYMKMPVVLSFLLIGFFIWVAENIATYFGAWIYPNQASTWHMVHLSKINSWFLLVIISIVIVVNLKFLKAEPTSMVCNQLPNDIMRDSSTM